MDVMTIDCNACAVAGPGCDDCVVSLLLGRPEDAQTQLTAEEQAAMAIFAAAGMLPTLRMAPRVEVRRSTAASTGLAPLPGLRRAQ